MSKVLKSLLYALNAVLLLGLTAYGVVAALDELSDPDAGLPPAAVRDTDPAAVPHPPGSGRAFVLFVDSLRDKTAESPELMPYLTEMKARGVSAVVDTVYDAVTVPAIRAAFTGKAHFRVLGFVQNFLRRSQNLPSLFTQLAARGDKVAVYSDMKTFLQFGGDISDHLLFEEGEGDSPTERQNAVARKALRQFESGSHRLVVFHVGYLDYVAHSHGIFAPEYREQAHAVDALVKELDARIPPEDTFVVLGDHGHTETGRHALGLDVPTYVLARGAAFQEGVRLKRLPITAYRYLLSWALGVPLSEDYKGERFPQALREAPGAPMPAAFKEGGHASSMQHVGRAGPLWLALLLAAGVGVAFAAWWTVGSWIAGGGVAAYPLRRAGRLALLGAGAGLAFFGVGLAQALLRTYVHEPFYPTMYRYWGFVLLGVLLVTRRFGLAPTMLVVLGVPFLLLWPTAYRYGAPAVMGPVWFIWIVAALVLSFRFKEGLPERIYARVGTWRVRRAIPLAIALIYLVQPYFFTDASNFEFTEWLALSPEIAPRSLVLRSLTGAACAWLVFWRRGGGWLSFGASLLFVLYFLAIYFRIIPDGSVGNFLAGAALLLGAVLLRRHARVGELHASARGLARTLFLFALFALYFFFVRATSDERLDAVVLFAALRLSVLLLDQLPIRHRDLALHAVFLLGLGLIASGWVALGWGLSRLEWSAAYDFFAPRVVEEYVGLFLPFIILKYALPVMIARSLVLERLSGEAAVPGRTLALGVGAKFTSLLLITLGLGWWSAGSSVYLEACGELAIFLALAAGLL